MMRRKTAITKKATKKVTKKAMPKMAKGGKMPMVMKNGKKVPAFAADGKGKMGYGGKLKKMKNGGKMKK
jgi:hypothetical protein